MVLLDEGWPPARANCYPGPGKTTAVVPLKYSMQQVSSFGQASKSKIKLWSLLFWCGRQAGGVRKLTPSPSRRLRTPY